tara:strand:- start:531 stop:1922 length:1392 start_codon:yes stop_codon:yes gene_type:complete
MYYSKSKINNKYFYFIFALIILLSINCSENNTNIRSETTINQKEQASYIPNEPKQVPREQKNQNPDANKNQQQVPRDQKNQNPDANKNQQQSSSEQTSKKLGWPYLQEPDCQGSGPVKFINSPMNIDDVKYLLPYGQVVGGHVTPIDHMYFEPKDRFLGPDIYPVRAIQDGVIFDIEKREVNVDTNADKKFPDWRLDIAHTCTFGSYFDLLTSVIPEIEEAYKSKNSNRILVKIKAGQIIGYIGGQTLDFGVYDYSYTLPGFINPKAYYDLEPWKVHTVDPFQYFPTPTKEELLAKMTRKVEPRAGKIDYDVDGTLSGNWFQKDTNYYVGIKREKYWDGHLSVAPDYIDPTIWIAAIGSIDDVYNNNFAIKSSIVPLDVNTSTGPVVYSIYRYNTYIVNDPARDWFRGPVYPDDQWGTRLNRDPSGIVMFELLETRLLKAEVFLGKTSDQVQSFTDKAKIYIR